MTTEEAIGDREAEENQPLRRPPSFASVTEREIAQVFMEVLEVKWVSPDDDIFTLGGDSFEALTIALELEKRFNIAFPVERLESAGRVRDLAAWIDSQRRSPAPEFGLDLSRDS